VLLAQHKRARHKPKLLAQKGKLMLEDAKRRGQADGQHQA
jgi:hypothetical protein